MNSDPDSQDSLQPLIQQLKLPSPITQVHSPLIEQQQVELFIKRDELIHPDIQGNKWRKLKYNLIQAIEEKHHTILSFGGAYSNHLHALAAAGSLCNLKTIGIIRGEAPSPLNPCLQDMQNSGMQLDFITRRQYREKTGADFLTSLRQQFGNFYLIPEGGNNAAGKQGCAEILDELNAPYDVICCEIGSGTMFSALIENNPFPNTEFIGFSVMKNPQLQADITAQLGEKIFDNTQWHINHDYHFGGFAKSSPELFQFIKQFKAQHHIQLEPVYSGKMLYGIMQMIAQGNFVKGSRICAIHGGGLQGIRGFPELLSAD